MKIKQMRALGKKCKAAEKKHRKSLKIILEKMGSDTGVGPTPEEIYNWEGSKKALMASLEELDEIFYKL